MERAHTDLHLAGKYTHFIMIWSCCVLPDVILCLLPNSSRYSKACRKTEFWFHVQKRGFLLLFFNIVFIFSASFVGM